MTLSFKKIMESASESNSPIEPTPTVITSSKPKASKPPRSKENTFKIFADAGQGLFAIAVILRIIVYIVHFVNYREFSPRYILLSFVILEAVITIFFLPCFMGLALGKVDYFKEIRKPLENLNDEVKWLTRMCYCSFVMAGFYTILGISSIYYVIHCRYRCDKADPDHDGRIRGQRNCTYVGYSNPECFAHPALLIPFVLPSMICMWAAGVIYLVTLVMFFGEESDEEVHLQEPQEATTVEIITPQEQSTTEQPSSSPIVPPTNEGSFRPVGASSTKGKTTRKSLSKETKYLVFKIMSQIVLAIGIALQSACYWVQLVPNIFLATTSRELISVYILCADLAMFVIYFSVMFWRELVRIVLTISKVWEPLGEDRKMEKSQQRDNLIISCIYVVFIVIDGIRGSYDAWSCWHSCETRCVKKCTKNCAMKMCENYGSNNARNETEEICIEAAEDNYCYKKCDNTATKEKCICGEICRNLGTVISLEVSALIAMLAVALMFLYLYKVLKKNRQPPKQEPSEEQVSFQNSGTQEINPVEEQASVKQSQK